MAKLPASPQATLADLVNTGTNKIVFINIKATASTSAPSTDSIYMLFETFCGLLQCTTCHIAEYKIGLRGPRVLYI